MWPAPASSLPAFLCILFAQDDVLADVRQGGRDLGIFAAIRLRVSYSVFIVAGSVANAEDCVLSCERRTLRDGTRNFDAHDACPLQVCMHRQRACSELFLIVTSRTKTSL